MFPDLFEDFATRNIPPTIFSAVLDALKFDAKILLFVGLLVLQIVVGALVGTIFALTMPVSPPRLTAAWKRSLLIAVALWLLTDVALLPLTGRGFFGSATTVGALALNLALLPSFLLFGLGLAGSFRVFSLVWAPPPEPAALNDVTNPERRRLLGGVAVGTVAVVALGWAYRITNSRDNQSGLAASPAKAASPVPVPTIVAAASVSGLASTVAAVTASPTTDGKGAWNITGLSADVTPAKDFYEVSKNFFSDPRLSADQWSLQIVGLVKQPRTLGYADVLKLPAVERYETLECISNEVGGDLIGNAAWKGIRLRDLLVSAEPDPRSTKVVFTAADGYTDSIPFTRALSEDNLLAYSMDGEPLLPEHGAPARLLIPGIYGMKNVKWLTKIELVSTNYLGYWQQRGWSDTAIYNTMSRIDVPLHKDLKAGPQEIAGIAFAGDRGISKVEVSVDDGTTWQSAILKERLGRFTWRLWRFDWNPRPGNYTITVRATDGTGQLQSATPTDTLPNGATGLHQLSVQVS